MGENHANPHTHFYLLNDIYASIKMLFMFLFLQFCYSVSQMFYSSVKILLTSGPNTKIPMVLSNVLLNIIIFQLTVKGMRDYYRQPS